MKIIYSMKLFLVIFLLTSISAYSEETSSRAPIGDWVTEKPHSSGAIITVQMKIEENHKFSGSALVNGTVNWTFSGDWEVSGNELTYTYRESSKPLPANYKDTDIIISVNDSSYHYKSKLSGEINTYTRIK